MAKRNQLLSVAEALSPEQFARFTEWVMRSWRTSQPVGWVRDPFNCPVQLWLRMTTDQTAGSVTIGYRRILGPPQPAYAPVVSYNIPNGGSISFDVTGPFATIIEWVDKQPSGTVDVYNLLERCQQIKSALGL